MAPEMKNPPRNTNPAVASVAAPDSPRPLVQPSDTRAPAMGYTEWTRRAVDATRRVLQELDA